MIESPACLTPAMSSSAATATAAQDPQTARQEEASSVSDRSLAVLDFVTGAEAPPGLMDIAAALHLPKATASRLCAHLEARQWLARHEGDRSFSPGPRLLSLAVRALQADPRQAMRHELLSRLVEQLGETCNLTVLDGTRVRYLDRVETHWPLRIQLEAGSLVPIHATASGKLFLAHMPEARRAAILDSVELAACTANTLTTPEALADECARIVRDGHACDREEFMRGMIAVAVPVRDAKGQCRATLAVHAPEARMPLEQALQGLPLLQAAAGKMSALLF